MQTYYLPPQNRSKPGIAIYIATTTAERTRLKRRGWVRTDAKTAYRELGKARCQSTPNRGLWEAQDSWLDTCTMTIENNWVHKNVLVSNMDHRQEL